MILPRFASWSLAAALALAPALLAQEPTNRDQSARTELREQGYPIKTGLRSVAAEAAELQDSDMVVGVVIGSEARAYPLNPMWGPVNEVLNDTVAGTPVSVTWCPVAHTAVVYDPRLEGRRLDLGAVGLRDGVSVLYDRQTGSWWSQVTGNAFEGRLRGRSLRQYPSTVTTWGLWRRLHPRTRVNSVPELPGLRRFTGETWSWMVTLGGSGPVANDDLVAGAARPGAARAWLLRQLHAAGRVANDSLADDPVVVFLASDAVTVRAFRRAAAGRVLRFRAEGDALVDEETGSRWDGLTGRGRSGPAVGAELENVPLTSALWYAWRSQHPASSLWSGWASEPAGEPRTPPAVPR